MDKRIWALIAAILLIVTYMWIPAVRVHAEGPEAVYPLGLGLGGDSEPGSIFMLDFYSPDVLYLKIGADPCELALEPTTNGWISWTYSVECEVIWHYEDIDTAVPGRYELIGDVIPPDGFVISCEAAMYYPVIVYDPDGPPSVKAAYINNPLRNSIVPLGMSGDDLAAFFDANIWNSPPFAVLITTEHGDSCYGTLTGWDLSLVDTSKAGTYCPFRIEPPPGVSIPAEMPGSVLYVLDPDEVSLRATDYDINWGRLYVRWLKEIDKPELWVSVDSDDWKPATDDYFIYSDSLIFRLNSNDSFFQPGHTYEFEVRYENGGVSVDTLLIDYTSGKPVFGPGAGGNRIGDRGETELPPVDIEDGTPTTQPGNIGDGTPNGSGKETPDTKPGSDGGTSANSGDKTTDKPFTEAGPKTSGAAPNNSGDGAPSQTPADIGDGAPALAASAITGGNNTATNNEDAATEPYESITPTPTAPPQPVPVMENRTDAKAMYTPTSENVVSPPEKEPDVNIQPDPQPPAQPYTDGWALIAVASGIGLAGAGVFFGLSRKRAVRRT